MGHMWSHSFLFCTTEETGINYSWAQQLLLFSKDLFIFIEKADSQKKKRQKDPPFVGPLTKWP